MLLLNHILGAVLNDHFDFYREKCPIPSQDSNTCSNMELFLIIP